jgi:hypothetical protein
VTDDTDLDRLFTRLSDEGRRRPAPDAHPAPEKLSAYLANELSPEEDEALQEHLVDCTLCADLLLDLQRFLDPPEEDRPREGVADFESAAEWRELRGRMGGQEKDAGSRKVRGPSRLRGAFGSLRAWQGVAAVLAVATLGIGGYSLHLRSGLLEPQGAIPLVLNSEVGERSGGEPIQEIHLPEKDKVIGLWLIVNSEPSYPAYQATIRRVETKSVVAVMGVYYSPKDGFTLSIHSGSLVPGEYEILVEGLRKGKPERVGLYRFKATR